MQWTSATCALYLYANEHKTNFLLWKMLSRLRNTTFGMVPYRLMANINLYESHTLAFFASSHRFWVSFQNSWPWKRRSRLLLTTFAVAPFDSDYMTFYLMATIMLAFSKRLLINIAPWKVLPLKFWSRSRSTTFAMVPFDGKFQPLCQSSLSIFRLLSPFSRYSHFTIRDLENVGQSHDV